MQTRMQQAYDQIRHKLVAGELTPGTRLVNRTLGKELGLSTVTVREALHRLTSEGAIEHIPNAGAFVRKLDRRSLAELYAFRSMLDDFAIVEAARRIEPFQLRELRGVCHDWRSMVREIEREPTRTARGELAARWSAADLRFHGIIYEAAGNQWLSKAVNELALLSLIAMSKPQKLSLADASRTWLEHARILRALRWRDVARAARMMRVHSEGAIAVIASQFGNGEA